MNRMRRKKEKEGSKILQITQLSHDAQKVSEAAVDAYETTQDDLWEK